MPSEVSNLTVVNMLKPTLNHRISLLAIALAAFTTTTRSAEAQSPDAVYLEHALAAERFIDSLRLDGEHGALWRHAIDSKEKPGHTVYYGSGGIAIFYLELHRATGDDRFLKVALSAGEEILAAIERDETKKISMSSGLAAEAFILGVLFEQTKDARYADAAREVLGRLKSSSQPLGDGVGWIEKNPYEAYSPENVNVGEMYDLSIGAAGAGLALLNGYRAGLDNEGKEWAVKVGDRLLEVAEHTGDGIRWPMMDNLPTQYIMPNFAHGPAGIGYFLAELYEDTKKKPYLDAAVSAAEYVQSRAVKKGDGLLVCHHERPDPTDLYYLGYCHGPAGTGRLMYKLYQITRDEQWLHWIERNISGLEATGAPEQRSEGFWNNVSQCCGDAGLGDFLLYMHRATKDDRYLNLARRVARHILAQSDFEDGKRSWTQAEMRIRPEWLQTQTGYMQGAAGIGSFFIHLATIGDEPVKIPLPATPFD